MRDDSVREEMIAKKTPVKQPAKFEPFQISEPKGNLLMTEKQKRKPIQKIQSDPPKHSVSRPITAQLNHKATNPTLVEFQHRENVIPEWRLQLQNKVRQHIKQTQTGGDDPSLPSAPRAINRTVGATALKPEFVEETVEVPVLHSHPKVQSALERIENSRKMFYIGDETEIEKPAETASKKDFPFYIATRNEEVSPVKTETKTPVYTVTKPKLVSSLKTEKKDLDTNKLPPLPIPAKIASSFETREVETAEETEIVKAEFVETDLPEIKISRRRDAETVENEESETDEIEDTAPFSLRFNSGLFDLLIGCFASLILLAPFMVLGGDWFTTAGLLAFLATTAIVMFVYLTTSVGMFGKTFGMHLFSLELIDMEENDYPTFHQAAVSSSVYLLSLALGGSGFLTIPFNDDKRAVHDIVSGTMVVRECG